ncbi:hypothetical protein KKF84_02150 [Myxococcota bacterium]|nr:hypothetical protein [Myxococcota bacterium]MBU1534089.1 hypothetical protein [Myxococcota bacterium]
MRKLLYILILALWVTSCDDSSGNNTNNECGTPCTLQGERRCESDLLEICSAVDSCMQWVLYTDCALVGETCTEAGDDPRCTGECTNHCTPENATRCEGNQLQTCETATDGCLDWAVTQDCSDNEETCVEQVGNAICAVDCELAGPAVPTDPLPAADNNLVDPGLTTALTWSADESSTHFAVYFSDLCPPPDYPDSSFATVLEPSLPVNLDYDTAYCWQVVAITDGGCESVSEVWNFETGTQCTEAPSCTDALDPPSEMTHFMSLDVPPMAPPPLSLCHEPRLRLSVNHITVHEEFDDMSNDIVYCIITAESPTRSEIQVLAPTPAMDQGESYSYSMPSNIFWGQTDTLVAPGGDLMITYDCFEQDDPSEYQDIIDTLGTEATSAGGTPGDGNGWIFNTPGAATPVAAAMIALNSSDDYLLHAQQIISAADFMALTAGNYWTVRKSGTMSLSDWDYELFIYAWGCVDNAI